MSHFKQVRFSIENNVATIILDRPDHGNALDLSLVEELSSAATLCDGDPTVRAVLLTGRGKLFCAGGDLKAMSAIGAHAASHVKTLADELHRAISTFARMAPPLVVAVNGTAAGGRVQPSDNRRLRAGGAFGKIYDGLQRCRLDARWQ